MLLDSVDVVCCQGCVSKGCVEGVCCVVLPDLIAAVGRPRLLLIGCIEEVC